MIPHVSALTGPRTAGTEHVLHAVVLVGDPTPRHAIAAQLREAGYQVTTAATFGVVELLLASAEEFDVLVTAQSFGEMSQFGLPQLARSVRQDLPIVVLELETIRGEGVIDVVRSTVARWPVRDHSSRRVH